MHSFESPLLQLNTRGVSKASTSTSTSFHRLSFAYWRVVTLAPRNKAKNKVSGCGKINVSIRGFVGWRSTWATGRLLQIVKRANKTPRFSLPDPWLGPTPPIMLVRSSMSCHVMRCVTYTGGMVLVRRKYVHVINMHFVFFWRFLCGALENVNLESERWFASWEVWKNITVYEWSCWRRCNSWDDSTS